MALVSSSTEAGVANKSITVESQGTAVAVMYTVPDGRTFTGYLWCNNSTYVGRVNDVDLRNPTSGIARLEVRLTAGDVVKASATASDYTFLQGLESNA